MLELADEHGYRDLPASDAGEPGRAGSGRRPTPGSLVRYLETFAHTVGVMQQPEAIHRVARECALDLAADGVVYAEVRFAPELSTAQGLPIEDVVEAMVDGFAAGSREATAAGTPIRVGALLCAMRQADRWDEVAGPRRPLPRRRRGRLRPGRPRDRLPARPHPRRPSASLDGAGAHRTIHAGEAAGVESIRAALDGARAERLGHGVRIADEVGADGTLGPLAQRVLDEQVALEIAPSSNVQTGAYPSLAEHPVDRLHRLGFAVTVNTDNRLMSGVSVSSELADVADHVRLVLGRRPDGHRACAGRRVRRRRRAEAAARPRSSGPGTPRSGLTEG